MAGKESVYINQFITLALAEKPSALMTEDYLEERAQRGNRADFLNVMSRVPDVAPEERDRL
jgi:hypothetical protein